MSDQLRSQEKWLLWLCCLHGELLPFISFIKKNTLITIETRQLKLNAIPNSEKRMKDENIGSI